MSVGVLCVMCVVMSIMCVMSVLCADWAMYMISSVMYLCVDPPAAEGKGIRKETEHLQT